MAETAKTFTCSECGQPFECTANWENQKVAQFKLRICPECKRKRKRLSDNKRWQRMKLRPGESRAYNIQHKKMEEVAKSLGISFANAKVIERRALAKIRENPELLKLFQQWMQDGGKAPTEPGERLISHEDVGNALVDYMLELSEWYEIHSKLVGRARNAEALECEREIANCHKALKTQLVKLSIINE